MYSKTIALLVLVAVAACNVHLNVKHRSFLNGEGLFDEKIANQIYDQFNSIHSEKSPFRFNIFRETLLEIRNHNMGRHSWRQGINDFSDITFEEFKEQKLMTPQNCSATNSFKLQTVKGVPESYEWNDYSMVSPVKNQGACGSCWTFSTVGAMESHWNILGKGRNMTFSEQQLVDCAGDFDNHGCNGGLPSHAFEYIKYNGLESDLTYPYHAKTEDCKHRKDVSVGHCRFGSYNITQGDEKQLAEKLYGTGPISVSFQVINGFKNYVSGVYSVNNCGKTTNDVNHAVLATGYGVQNGKKYWNIKNSWGPTWGNQGYFRMEREANMCAVAQCNSFPLIDFPNMVVQE